MRKKVLPPATVGRNGPSPLFLSLLLMIFIGFVVLFVYWARLNGKFGFGRYTDFTLEECREPIILGSIKDFGNGGNVPDWQSVEKPENGIALSLPKNWRFTSECYEPFCVRSENAANGMFSWVSVTRYPKGETIPNVVRSDSDTLVNFVKSSLSCAYGMLNGKRVVVQQDSKDKYRTAYYVQGNDANYVVLITGLTGSEYRLGQQIANSLREIPRKQQYVGDTGPYDGTPSPRVPYKNLVFSDIDIHSKEQREATFMSSPDGNGKYMTGLTFLMDKDELVTFQLHQYNSQNGLSEGNTELYGYGPSVIQKETYMEFRAPVTGRYFLVVILRNKDDAKFDIWTRVSR